MRQILQNNIKNQTQSNFSKMKLVIAFVIHIFLINLISLFNFSEAKSQGFDWIYSNRLPFEVPNFFIGGKIEVGLINHSGDLSLREMYNATDFECCRYKNGSGTSMNVGVSIEYWYETFSAVNLSLSYNNISSNFNRSSEPIPLSNGDNLITEYDYATNLSFVNIELGWRYKIMETHIFVNPSLNTNVFLSKSDGQQVERIISPDYETFSDGSIIRNIESGKIPEINTFNINFNLKAGYDFSIMNGMYVSPYIGYILPISNYVSGNNTNNNSNETWRMSGVLFGANIMYGL